MIKLEVVNHVDCQVHGTAAERKIVRGLLGFKGVFFHKTQYAMKRTTYTQSMMLRNGVFPTGLLPRLRQSLDRQGIPYKVTTHQELEYLPTNGDGLVEGFTLREDQERLVKAAVTIQRGIILSPTGTGKCLGAGTPVLMYDGHVLPVEDVQIGDLLMGPDSKPRHVTSTNHNRGMLYQITPVKGEPYIVNEDHILSLKKTRERNKPRWGTEFIDKGTVVNISVRDYLKRSVWWKHLYKGWRTEVEFLQTENPLPLDPYFLGLWLGDGNSRKPTITTADKEISKYIHWFALQHGMRIRREPLKTGNGENLHIVHVNKTNTPYQKGKGHGPPINPIHTKLTSLNLIQNKHIPHIYKTSSQAERLNLLAGILDSDGHWSINKYYEVVFKSERLMDDLIFLVRSLGFSAYKVETKKICTNTGITGNYFRCNINGPVDSIPCKVERKKATVRIQKKDVLVTGISVEQIGTGDFYGFELEGPDRLFLLGDFTVTHNTILMMHILSHFSIGKSMAKAIILVHNKTILTQTIRELEKHGFSPVFKLGDGESILQGNLVVATRQSMVTNTVRDVDRKKIEMPMLREEHQEWMSDLDVLMIDECHNFGDEWGQYATILRTTDAPVRLGFTATKPPEGSHVALALEGMVGPVIEQVTMEEGLEKGLLALPKIELVPIKTNSEIAYLRVYKDIYKAGITNNRSRNRLAISKAKAMNAEGKSVIIFVQEIEHGDRLVDLARLMELPVEFVWQETTTDERDSIADDMEAGLILCVIASKVWREGLNIPTLGGVILAGGGKAELATLQAVGRSLRRAEGKDRAIIVDFLDPYKYLAEHSIERISTFVKQGWL